MAKATKTNRAKQTQDAGAAPNVSKPRQSTSEAVIKTVALSSAEELIRELLPVTGRIWSGFRAGDAAREWVFRGQRDARWGLQPSAFRKDPFGKFVDVDVRTLPAGLMDDERVEHHHVIKFVQVADALGFHIPGDIPQLRDSRPQPQYIGDGLSPRFFPPTPYVYMYALAQHYGVPTRLLDWTYTPLAAAYFAATGTPDGKGSPELGVWAMDRTVVNERLGSATWEERGRGPMVSFINPPTATNPNLAAQAGLFSVVHDPDMRGVTPKGQRYKAHRLRDLDKLLRDNEDRFADDDRPVLFKFTLPERQIGRLLRLLAEHRVQAGSIYPGLAGVAKALMEERLHG